MYLEKNAGRVVRLGHSEQTCTTSTGNPTSMGDPFFRTVVEG